MGKESFLKAQVAETSSLPKSSPASTAFLKIVCQEQIKNIKCSLQILVILFVFVISVFVYLYIWYDIFLPLDGITNL